MFSPLTIKKLPAALVRNDQLGNEFLQSKSWLASTAYKYAGTVFENKLFFIHTFMCINRGERTNIEKNKEILIIKEIVETFCSIFNLYMAL